MFDYRRVHAPGGTYFFTVNTYRCQRFLTDADVCSALREAIETLRLTHPFVGGQQFKEATSNLNGADFGE